MFILFKFTAAFYADCRTANSQRKYTKAEALILALRIPAKYFVFIFKVELMYLPSLPSPEI